MQRFFLSTTAFVLLVTMGILFPDQLVKGLDGAENVADVLGSGMEGYWALLWRFADPASALLLVGSVLTVGVGGKIALGLFKTRAILMAGFLPAAAGATKAGLALGSPATLEPVDWLSRWMLDILPKEQQIQAKFFGLEQLLQTLIIVLILSAIISAIIFLWRWYRRGKQTQMVSLE